jgi:hypothetical protein
MNKDPAKQHGVRTIQQKVAFHEVTHLTRYAVFLMYQTLYCVSNGTFYRKFVSDIMHLHDNDAFEGREPAAKHIFCVPKHPIGIHERWSGDGHDKLYKIGFPVWAMVDDATGKWLGSWVVPSNRMGEIVAYLFLCVVEKFEGMSMYTSECTLAQSYVLTPSGMPLQSSTDCGSETTKLFGLTNALRYENFVHSLHSCNLNHFLSAPSFTRSTTLANCPLTSICEAFTIFPLNIRGCASVLIGVTMLFSSSTRASKEGYITLMTRSNSKQASKLMLLVTDCFEVTFVSGFGRSYYVQI